MTKPKLKYKIYSILSDLYYYLLIIIVVLVSAILMNYRMKFWSFFNFNLLSYYLSIFIFYPCLFLAFWLIMKPIRKLKNKLSTKITDWKEPSYIQQYGLNFKEPTFENYEITKEEYIRYVNIPKINFGFVSMILGLLYVIFLANRQDSNFSTFTYITFGFTLVLILLKFIINKINIYLYKKNMPNKKAEEYKIALEIYQKIQKEKRELKESNLF